MLAMLVLMLIKLGVIIMTVLTSMSLRRQEALLAIVYQALRTEHTVHDSEWAG